MRLTSWQNTHAQSLGPFADCFQPAEQASLQNVGSEHGIGCRRTIEPLDFTFDATLPAQWVTKMMGPNQISWRYGGRIGFPWSP
jgi:hypothetical protein